MLARTYASTHSLGWAKLPVRGILLLWIALGQGVLAHPQDLAPPTITVHPDKALGVFDGFGISEAFGQAAAVHALTPGKQEEVINLLFDRANGANLKILRLGINTDSTLVRNSPPVAGKEPLYNFDGSDGSQVWMAQQAMRHGVRRFTAAAWTAPAYMKNNGNLVGGALCGLPEVSCTSGDWRQDFARYLLEDVRSYRRMGIPVESLSFLNEPDIPVGYASMAFSPAQAVDFIEVLGPMARHTMPDLKLACCDASKWSTGKAFAEALEADRAASSYVSLYTAHEYGSHASEPLPTAKPVWMTEWSSGASQFQPRWDCGACANNQDGMALAHDILQAFSKGGIRAYIYWWGAGDGPANLIQIKNGDYVVSKRFYAITAVSRFVEPGAQRIAATANREMLESLAFRNGDGSVVLCVLNSQNAAIPLQINIEAEARQFNTEVLFTDISNSLVPLDFEHEDQVVSVVMPRRSLLTVLFRPKK